MLKQKTNYWYDLLQSPSHVCILCVLALVGWSVRSYLEGQRQCSTSCVIFSFLAGLWAFVKVSLSILHHNVVTPKDSNSNNKIAREPAELLPLTSNLDLVDWSIQTPRQFAVNCNQPICRGWWNASSISLTCSRPSFSRAVTKATYQVAKCKCRFWVLF